MRDSIDISRQPCRVCGLPLASGKLYAWTARDGGLHRECQSRIVLITGWLAVRAMRLYTYTKQRWGK